MLAAATLRLLDSWLRCVTLPQSLSLPHIHYITLRYYIIIIYVDVDTIHAVY